MVARMINLMGAYFGPEKSVGEMTSANPKGYWERPEAFALNESILEQQGCSWKDLRNFVPAKVCQLSEKTQEKIRRLVFGMDAFRPWVLKDPRLCLLLPAWLPYLEVPLAVIVHRNPAEIAISLHSRDGLSTRYSMALWEAYSVSLLNSSIDMPRLHVCHGALLRDPFNTAVTLFTQLREHGVRRIELPSEREIQSFVEPDLYRSRPVLPPDYYQQQITDMLLGKIPQKTILKVSDACKDILRDGPRIETRRP